MSLIELGHKSQKCFNIRKYNKVILYSHYDAIPTQM